MGTPIDRAGSGGFGVTRRGRTGGSLVADKGGSQAETVLDGVEEVERDTDWKALLVRHTWSILCAALYYVLGLVSVGHLYSMVVIWF